MGTPGLAYAERSFTAQDGLALHYREYGDPAGARTPLLCLAGLTRNAKDFHDLALRHAGTRRVLAPDYRGRGRSAYDRDWRHYAPEVYLRDIQHLLAAADAHRVIVVGTSLGGILAMGMAVALPTALAAVVLNDVGPEIDPAGVAHIRSYLGKQAPLDDWAAAAARVRDMYGPAYPDFGDDDWRGYARRLFREGADGAPEIDYDPAISRLFEEGAGVPADLWALFGALEKVPTMLVRGALSNILAADTARRMAEVKPDLVTVTVSNRGHVPLLDEPECRAPLDDFLARF